MIDFSEKLIAATVTSCLFCLSTVKLVGVMQQSGYKAKGFWGWIRRKDNLAFNRLSVLALCLALASAVTSLCFSFFGTRWAVLASALPFLGLILFFGKADNKYALKLPAIHTGRWRRLFGGYLFVTAFCSFVFISILNLLAEWNGSKMYAYIAYVPFALTPTLLPVYLWIANVFLAPFENARNRRFVKRAGQVLNEREIIRVAVVGSYGKTSVKNILKSILQEKYSVVETPASYNTPMGIAKTVLGEDFTGKQVFIAEMGARKAGDIAELCTLVRPDYALFTGVCEQHIATFESLEKVFAEKSEILRCGAKKVVCGERLRPRVLERFAGNLAESVIFAGEVENLRLGGKETAFTLRLDGEEIEVNTPLLGRSAAENISLAATLALQMGMTTAEIAAGIAKLQPIEHRLQRIESNGVYILDDGYNCNVEGAKVALEVLRLSQGNRWVVTPGIVEGGVLEESLNTRLGEMISECAPERVLLVGETLVTTVKEGYKAAGGDMQKVEIVPTLAAAQEKLREGLSAGDTVLFLNDLPDVY